MNSKPWYQSKTIWFNVITTAVEFLAMPEFVHVIPAAALPYIAVGQAFGNIILRKFFTTVPIS